MKRSSVVRLIFIFATTICAGNLFFDFLRFTYEGAWEWNHLTLFSMIESISMSSGFNAWHFFPIIGTMAFLSGFLPLVLGCVGSVRPGSESLPIISVITSSIVVLSVAGVYIAIMIAVNSQGHRPVIEPKMGTYMTVAIIAMECYAGLLSRKIINETANVP